MKKIIQVILITGMIIFSSCNKKAEVAPEDKKIIPSASILGKWSVEDLNTSLESRNLSPFISSYKGTAADYYNFLEDGAIDVQVGGKKDIMKYKLDNQTIILSFHDLIIDTMRITELTENRLTISMIKKLPYDQIYSKTYSLKR